jgi:hypothetical protein
MSFKPADNASAITTAIGWFGLAALAFIAVWQIPAESLTWWVKIAAGLTGALALVGNGIDAYSQELTVHRWALSQFVFTTVTIVLIVAAILNSNVLGLGRVVMVVLAAVYLLGAAFCAAAAKDLF